MLFHGSCLCGSVKIKIKGSVDQIVRCYCSLCQKAHGSDYSAWGICQKAAFEIAHGAEHVKMYESTPGVERSFCSSCGSNLQWKDSTEFNENYASFSLALLDQPLVNVPISEYYKTDDHELSVT
jgi:hypothetical protein